MLRIKNIRERKNISQDEMVSLTGISKRSYINYEHEKTDIPLSKLQKIADALEVSIIDLIERTEKAEQKESLTAADRKLLSTLSTMHRDIKEDLKVIHESLVSATETLSEGMFYNLKEQQKIITFIEKLSAEEINDATKNLNKFLESQK